jgi:hypothetical protein
MTPLSPFLAMFIPALVASLGGVLAIIWHPSHHATAWVLISAFSVGGRITLPRLISGVRYDQRVARCCDHISIDSYLLDCDIR